MTTVAQHKSEGVGKPLIVYLCILALAGLQFVIAYQDISAGQMLRRMLSVAIVEAGIAVLFFMHLWSEKRAFLVFVLVFTISVLLAMQYGWTDSFRLLHCGGYCS
ncbi:MAG: cytochrome C oxidase subunit IV family protein [Terriglobales bacterium]